MSVIICVYLFFVCIEGVDSVNVWIPIKYVFTCMYVCIYIYVIHMCGVDPAEGLSFCDYNVCTCAYYVQWIYRYRSLYVYVCMQISICMYIHLYMYLCIYNIVWGVDPGDILSSEECIYTFMFIYIHFIYI